MSQQSAVANTVSLTVNGEKRSVPEGWTVADLLASHKLDSRAVVVEHNRAILHDRGRHSSVRLDSGDSVEIVHFVGGG